MIEDRRVGSIVETGQHAIIRMLRSAVVRRYRDIGGKRKVAVDVILRVHAVVRLCTAGHIRENGTIMKRLQVIVGMILGLAVVFVLAACGVAGTAVPAQPALTTAQATTTTTAAPTTSAAPFPQTVYVQPPATRTVYLQPSAYPPASTQWYAQPSWFDSQPWISITAAPGQTACQWLYAKGYSYAQAFAAWAQNGYPANWSATNDGYPCQRTYGIQH